MSNGSGILSGGNINNVNVDCSTNLFIVNASAGSNGSISPSGPQFASSGCSITFTATPDSGYGVNEWRVDGNLVQAGGASYQLNNITSDQTVSVSFGSFSISSSVSTLDLAINCLPSSSCATTQNAALTGTPRQIVITNTGSLSVTNLSVTPSGLPTGTTISNNTCTGTLAPSSSCLITLTPGDIASGDFDDNPCTVGTAPIPDTVLVSADGDLFNVIVIKVLGYGCQHQGGFIYAIDDTTPNTGSISGKVASLVDQAAPVGGVTSIVWSSSGVSEISPNSTAILGVDELSTSSVPSPTSPAYPVGTPAYTACNGSSDGLCNWSNIISYYNFNREAGGSAPTPLNFYAAGLCAATISSYSDWYLPATCEMDAVSGGITCPADTQSMISNISFLIGDSISGTPSTSCSPPSGTDCLAGNYWSSTEFSGSPMVFAWSQLFDVSSSRNAFAKGTLSGVRCSRNF